MSMGGVLTQTSMRHQCLIKFSGNDCDMLHGSHGYLANNCMLIDDQKLTCVCGTLMHGPTLRKSLSCLGLQTPLPMASRAGSLRLRWLGGRFRSGVRGAKTVYVWIYPDQTATLADTPFGFVVPRTPKPNGLFWRISNRFDLCFQSQLLPNPPVWLRRPWDTKVKWGISQHGHLAPERSPRTEIRRQFDIGSQRQLWQLGVGRAGPFVVWLWH
jgi:hypothetical protein